MAWCDVNKYNILRLHDYCLNPNCKCRKQITFTLKHIQIEGAGFENTMKKTLQGSQKDWNSFRIPTINTLTPVIDMAVGERR